MTEDRFTHLASAEERRISLADRQQRERRQLALCERAAAALEAVVKDMTPDDAPLSLDIRSRLIGIGLTVTHQGVVAGRDDTPF